MDRHKASSQASLDRKHHAGKDGSISSINKQNQLQNEIDNFIQHGILDPMFEYDPKFDFICAPIVIRDHVIKQTRRQTCGLIWNSIRSPSISRLVYDGCSCGFVEILRVPSEWSRYDTDSLLLKIRQKKYLNGLALRDEFVRVLNTILKRDFNEETNTEKKHPYEFKDLDFTRNMIQLVFTNRHDSELNLVISFVLLIEFDIPCTNFFYDTYTALCHHHDFDECFKLNHDINRTRVTPLNSIKFLLDFTLTEANICDFILQKSCPMSSMLSSFMKVRKEWVKYVQRASKYAVDTIKIQMHSEKQRQSTCSVNSSRSGTSNASNINKMMQNKVPLATELEVAFESIFSVSLVRFLFLTVCSQHKQFGATYENDIAYAIEKSLQLLGDGLEKNYLEDPFLKHINILPDSLLTHEMSVKIGIKRLVKEMQREWKRNIRR